MKKKSAYYIIIATIAAMSLISCESEDPNVTLPYEEKIVISGLIEPGSDLNVILSRTLPPLSNGLEDDALTSPSPTVTLSSGGKTWELSKADDDARRYILKDIEFRAGETYRLDVNWKGLHAYATTTIPQPAEFDHITYSTAYEVWEGDREYIDSFYRYKLYIKVPETAVFNGGFAMIEDGHKYYSYSNFLSNGRSKDKDGFCRIELDTYGMWEDPEYIKERYNFFIDVYDPAYEKFYISQDDGGSPDEIFSSGGMNIKGNINGDGIGIFIGRNTSYKSARDLIQ